MSFLRRRSQKKLRTTFRTQVSGRTGTECVSATEAAKQYEEMSSPFSGEVLSASFECAEPVLRETEEDVEQESKSPQPGSVLTFIVSSMERLDRFLSCQTALEDLSRERIKQAIRAGQCLIDGLPCREPAVRLKPGQRVDFMRKEEESTLKAVEGPLTCVYVDDSIAVVNKPSGLSVHPCPSCKEETLVHRLLYRFPQLAALGGERPGIVHRLDKDTSGLLIVALTEAARLRLAADFAARAVHKVYLALVHGIPPETGYCNAPIGRHPSIKVKMAVQKGGREAFTSWQRLYTSPDGTCSLLAIRLHTGRTHQIRVHMQHMGFPLLGDPLYGQRHTPERNSAGETGGGIMVRCAEPECCTRQMLHAWRLHFRHPLTEQPLTFIGEPPEDFWEVMARLHRRMSKVVITGCPGCGKSALTHMLGAKGYPVWSADAEVASLYAQGGEISGVLRMRWGERFVTSAGEVNKAALLEAMRHDPECRKAIEAIVHPFVYAALDRFWKASEEQGAVLAVAEVPLWFESCSAGVNALKEQSIEEVFVVGVACDRHIRHQRLQERRGWSRELIALMDSWQWSEEKKMAFCDSVLNNSSTLTALETQADRLLADMLHTAIQRQQQGVASVRSRLETLQLQLSREESVAS